MNFDFLEKPIDEKALIRALRRFWREGFLVFLLILLIVSFFQTNKLGYKLSQQEDLLSGTQSDIARLKIEVGTLIATSAENTKAEIEKRLVEESGKITSLQTALSSETQKRKDLETKLSTETGLSATRFTELQSSLKNNYDLAGIIGEWRKRTAHVTCSFGIFGTSRGSGVLVYISDGNGLRYGVLTNEHVLSASGRLATSCTAVFPDNAYNFTARRDANEIQISTKGYDFGILFISSPNSFVTSTAANESRLCKANPAVGDETVILGYPVIGSGNDITATEGIISGFDGDYYITSAKVEQGNSGGGAILLKNNCMLGIPTFVQLGNLEALARILKMSVILN